MLSNANLSTLSAGMSREMSGDVDSVWSDVSAPSDALQSVEELKETFDEAINKMTERRASSRTEGILSLNKLMSRRIVKDNILDELSTLSTLLQSSLKRGSGAELTSACHCIELICLSASDDASSLYGFVRPALRHLSKHCHDPEGASAAIRAMGIIGFMTTHDRHDAMAWLPLFAKFFRRIEGNIACAALDAWGLVLSCLDSKEMLECSKSAMPTLQALLESSSLDVRSGAGEVLALIFEAKWEIENQSSEEEESEEEDSEEEESEDDEYKSSSSEEEDIDEHIDGRILADEDIDPEELVFMLSKLSKDSKKSRGRKERAKGRSLFRDVLDTVESGNAPSFSMTIHGVLKKFDTWCDIIRLSSLRLTLAEGFHAHMCRNETVREIFGIDDPIKEQTMSGSKKARQKVKDKEEIMWEHKVAARAFADRKKGARKAKRAFMSQD